MSGAREQAKHSRHSGLAHGLPPGPACRESPTGVFLGEEIDEMMLTDCDHRVSPAVFMAPICSLKFVLSNVGRNSG